MALFVTTGKNKITTVYIGYLYIPDGDPIIEVQANGHELEYIRNTMSNIPMVTNKKVVRWYGDHAKFIANNF